MAQNNTITLFESRQTLFLGGRKLEEVQAGREDTLFGLPKPH